jgi:hypothetical protein
VAEYKEDPKTRISFGRIRWIQKYASTEATRKAKAQELIKKSYRTLYSGLAIPLTVFVVIFGWYYFYLTQAYYFGTDNYEIVLRSGHPGFTFLPGFGRVVIQTNFKTQHLKDGTARNEIDQAKVKGFWFQKVDSPKGAYQLWGEQLARRLDPIGQARMLNLLGNTGPTMETLIEIITNPEADPTSINYASNTLEIIVLAKSEDVNANMLDKLIEFIIVNSSDINPCNNCSQVTSTLELLAQARPDTVNANMLIKMFEFVNTTSSNTNSRSFAVRALGALAQAKPNAVSSEMLNKMFEIVIADSSNLGFVGTRTLGSLAQARPDGVNTDMLNRLIEYVISDSSDYNSSVSRFSIASAVEVLVQAKPDALSASMLNKLIEFVITDSYPYPAETRDSVAFTLGSLAQARPDLVNANMLNKLIKFVITDTPPYAFDTRARVARELISFGPAKLDATNPDILYSLLDYALTDSPPKNTDTSCKPDSYATDILGALAQTNPDAVNADMLNKLVEATIADSTDLYGYCRNYAEALQSLVHTKPDAVNEDMLNKLIKFAAVSSGINYDDSVVRALASLVQAKPDAISAAEINNLVESLVSDASLGDYPHGFYNIDNSQSLSLIALGSIAQTRPDAVNADLINQLQQYIVANSSTSNINIRFSAAKALIQLTLADAQKSTQTTHFLSICSTRMPIALGEILQQMRSSKSPSKIHCREIQ